MTDRIRASQPDEGLRRAQHADSRTRVREILRDVADRVDRSNPQAPMTDHTLTVAVRLAVWSEHGVYTDIHVVADDVVATRSAIKDIPLDGTRAEYATRLRLRLSAVSI